MRILVDTNVVLDVLLKRVPFFAEGAAVFRLSKRGVQSWVSAASVTDIHYLARKELKDSEQTLAVLKRFLRVVQIAGVSKREIFAALGSGWADFEDAVQNAVAEAHDFDAIVTRDPAGFAKSFVPVYSPADFLRHFSHSQDKEP